MADEAIEAFIEECSELLSVMEDALLQIEHDPGSDELINAIFRAAHTIKGTSGVFSFDDLVEFTHVVENVLDRVRDGSITIESNLVACLLSCRDHIGTLVQIAVDNSKSIDAEVKATGDELVRQLEAFLGAQNLEMQTSISTELVEEMHSALDKTGIQVASTNWHISLRFDKDVLRHGMDPLSFLRYLRNIGELVQVTTITDNLPDLVDADPEQCYLGFEIAFLANEGVDKAKIESVFEFVRDMCQLFILPPEADIGEFSQLIESLPEENMRIGEILCAVGALTDNELKEALEYSKAAAGKTGEPAPKLGEVLVEKKAVHQQTVDNALDKQAKAATDTSNKSRVIRVDASKLDSLINLVGELVIAGARTNLLAQSLKNENLLESVATMEHLVEEIRDSALNLRMVQIGDTFNRFQRVVRDVSKEIGKDIRLEINGADTELDKTVVEKIADPLMHLVRNAMDHGIEPADVRTANGKSPQGLVELNAYHDSGSIVIEVNDDGGGLSKDRIIAKAIEKGLISDASNMSENEIYRLIFEAGFSTAAEVTNLSGRGVGMDVVKKNIEALRGTVDVCSKVGEGTTISIRLPLTLAIIDGFLVGVGESSYVIPLDMIHECVELSELDQEESNNKRYINLRGEVLPFLRLRDLFGEPEREHVRENIVVVESGEQKAGFVVDELLGELQTVIKPMGKVLQSIQGVSGATILGSGDVAVILDIPNLIKRVANQHDNVLSTDKKTLH